jgi:hypothetical protein
MTGFIYTKLKFGSQTQSSAPLSPIAPLNRALNAGVMPSGFYFWIRVYDFRVEG